MAPSNGSKHGDAKTESLGEKYAARHNRLDELVQRAEIRDELVSEEWDVEDSKVIHTEVDRILVERRPKTDPPGIVGGFQRVTRGWPWYAQLTLVLALLAAIAWKGDDLLRLLKLLP